MVLNAYYNLANIFSLSLTNSQKVFFFTFLRFEKNLNILNVGG